MEGRLYAKFRNEKIIKKLKRKVLNYDCDWFFKRFCMSLEKIKFLSNLGDFKARNFLVEYNKFLSYCLYNWNRR